MTQLFSANATAVTRLLLALGLLILLMVLGGLYIYSRSPLAAPHGQYLEQPIPFSHKHHVGNLNIDCRYCHTTVAQSRFAGMPDSQTCMSCHAQLWTHAEVLKPLRDSVAKQKPIAWRRVHDMPDYVYFSHRAHVNNGVACQSCHGRVDQMPLVRQAEPMTMRWCLDCHREPLENLRAPDQITEMGAAAPLPDAEHLQELYEIHRERLTDCVTCHR